jgi:hypothetical protein
MAVRFFVSPFFIVFLLSNLKRFEKKNTIVMLRIMGKRRWLLCVGAFGMRGPGIFEGAEERRNQRALPEMRGVLGLQHKVGAGGALEIVQDVRVCAVHEHVPERQKLCHVLKDRHRVAAVSQRACGCRCVFFSRSILLDFFFMLVLTPSFFLFFCNRLSVRVISIKYNVCSLATRRAQC